MTSFIVVSTDKKKRDLYLQNFYKTHEIDTFDQTTLTLETSVKQNTQSIGIEDIKHMQKKLFLKPIKSNNKVVIIEDAQLLTHEAQNALLKVLEEPPANTFIMLATDSRDSLLPTILSRCHIIKLETETHTLSEKEIAEYQTFIESLKTLSIAERLKKAEMLAKDKEKALMWIGKLIIILHDKMLEQTENARYPQCIKALQDLHTLLKATNINTRFAIENTLIQLSLT